MILVDIKSSKNRISSQKLVTQNRLGDVMNIIGT